MAAQDRFYCICIINITGERIQCWKNLREANDSRDALAKDLYSRLFGWIVGQVNRNMWANTQNHNRLDLFCHSEYCGMGGSRGGWGGAGGPDPSEKSQNIGFLSNTDPDPLKNHKAT